MSVRSRCALSGALILVSLAAPVAAEAVPVTVNVRVEGTTSTIFDGPVVTDGHDLSPPSGGGSHVCDGTNNAAFPAPGPTATAALDDAARAGGFTWDGTWNTGFQDFLVSRIATEQENPPSQFWGHFVNGEFATAGGCQTRLAAGDETVWAFDAFNKGAILKLEGPTVATTGSRVSFRVSDTAPSGPNLPAAGASVNGTPTGSDGIATLTFPTEGIFSVKADRPDAVRSNSVRICVDPAGALPCSSTDATGPAVMFGAAGGQRGGLASTRGRSRTMLISWAGDDGAGSGVSHYKAEVTQVGDGAGASQSSWRTLIDRTTVNGVHFRGEAGDAYVFRITATDRALNETTVTTDPVILPVDDRSQRLLRFSKRSWKRVRAGNAWGGTVVRAKKAGARARLRFRGTSLSLIGRKRAKGGRLRATIDGRRTTIRLRGRSAHRSVLWTSRKLEPGAHTLVLRALGGGTVEFDAVAPRP